jgi:exodeoxyribonuclease V alpha subunit
LITALMGALEQGELALELGGAAPAGVTAAAWPQQHLQALQASALGRDPDGPLVLESGSGGERLLWRRWQERRSHVLEDLLKRATAGGEAAAARVAPQEAMAGLDDRQQQAVAAVLNHGLVLLEGGPGTGKTSTVAGMIKAVLAQDPGQRIHLAAPTGKAAARLAGAGDGLLPCTTLHRLLESRGDGFGRHRGRPLELDLLVVDEVSMVDLALMEALLEALPATSRLVLVGDPAQLPPVAPGPVLQELQRPQWRRALGSAAITLETTYRNAGAMAAVASELRRQLEGDAGSDASPRAAGPEPTDDPLAGLRPVLGNLPAGANLQWLEAAGQQLPPALISQLQQHQRNLAGLARACRPDQPEGAAALLALRDQLLVLTPLRQGPWGLAAIHRALLGQAIEGSPLQWPCGTPVLCCRNLADLGLANGDVGVLVGEAGDGARRRILFGQADRGEPIWIHPAQLSGAAEPALALTVHKAQGSEADAVVVLMPRGEPRDLRLLYTALTRARQQVLLISADREGT